MKKMKSSMKYTWMNQSITKRSKTCIYKIRHFHFISALNIPANSVLVKKDSIFLESAVEIVSENCDIKLLELHVV